MWTIFGAGDLVWDIIDAIIAREENVGQIVLNQKVNVINFPYESMSLKKYLKTTYWETEHRIFGFIDPNKSKLLTQLNQPINKFSNLIHPRAWVCNTAQFGHGNFFSANSTLASKTFLGDFNYINRNASIGHHTTMGSYNHIGPGATVCGKCTMGNSNFLGAGCVIKDGVKIGNNVIVGANSLVINDLLEKGVYIGSPVKLLNSVPLGIAAKFYA